MEPREKLDLLDKIDDKNIDGVKKIINDWIKELER